MKQRRNRSESNYKRAKINSWCRLLEKDFDRDYTFLLEIERKKIIEMYEYFKKVGPEIRKKFINNEITDKEFQDWIDSTKVRKK